MNVSPSSIATTLGIGSGIDMAGLAVQLAEAQFAGRNERLTARSETLERQISLAGSIRSSFSLFASALGDRLRTGDLAPVPTISNASVASVSTPLGALGKGTYSLEVNSLASNQTLTGPVYASASDTVGAGTLTIRFGATSNAAFTENTERPPLALDIVPGSTLADVANAINSGNAGLTAYVAQTAAGAQLVMKGAEGLENGFVIEATEDGANPGLSALAWQPGGDPARLVKASADAEYLLDGLLRRTSSNTIPNAAPGLSLSLTGTNAGAPATIGFANSNGAISGVMQDITGALNEIISELRTATNPLGGDLSRDPGARALSRNLSALGSTVILPNAPEGSPRTLAELGLAIERDGSFRFDSAKLTQALERDPAGVAAMFTTGINGVYSTIDRLARSSSSSSDPGSLAGSIVRYQSQSQQISSDLTKLAEQQETLRASMVARFAQADSRVAASKSTLSFLQSQIDAWNAQSN
ncbi:flagellar filament capping protein FliD [Qipengyuania sp. DY56-A-20]|jgi:flagellar hook-associated protein 2|uniref:Flagellar hook-associated protein 2 n=1 Tax=Qipengyuania benthica TaxID=3067651 RepID=A0ABT9H6Q9_9SPHN|nr:flagellar filament capping protein FliD [Qipengyuania sp. DY56-A-20]MBU1254524.1 flagellar filament capping protein FliD [Alphaproteobacteria bacterium]MBU1606172.1 flagellar filament capping protein FliD [Alphaproteobacteria bacterium]MDP4538555.1 flagellar filament capping protein FliD [Qipengyuania sp. DY56-A-20]